MRARDGFILDPYRACLGLAAAAVKRGATIFEQTRAKKVRVGAPPRRSRSWTAALIKAATVDRRHRHRHGRVPAAAPPLQDARGLSRADRADAGGDAQAGRQPRRHGEGSRGRRPPRRVDRGRAAAGGRRRSGRDAGAPARRGAGAAHRSADVRSVDDVSGHRRAAARSGAGKRPYGETADGLPYIGPHRNYPRHLFALGGGGDSLTGAFLAARMLVRALQGQAEKSDEVFGWTR